MKKLFLLLVGILIFSACDKPEEPGEEEPTKTADTRIVGTWIFDRFQVMDIEANNETSKAQITRYIEVTYGESRPSWEIILTYSHTGKRYDSDSLINDTYTYSNNLLVITSEAGKENTYPATISDDVLQIELNFAGEFTEKLNLADLGIDTTNLIISNVYVTEIFNRSKE